MTTSESDRRKAHTGRIVGLGTILAMLAATAAGTLAPVSMRWADISNPLTWDYQPDDIALVWALGGSLVVLLLCWGVAYVIVERRLPRPSRPSNPFAGLRDAPPPSRGRILWAFALAFGARIVLWIKPPILIGPSQSASGNYAATMDSMTFLDVSAPFLDVARELIWSVFVLVIAAAGLLAVRWGAERFMGNVPPRVETPQTPILGGDEA